MFAVGCLCLVVFPLAGLVIGLWLAGTQGAIAGAVAGLVIAVAICAVPAYALIKASRRG